MRWWKVSISLLLIASLTTGVAIRARAQAEPELRVSAEVGHDLSPALRDLAAAVAARPRSGVHGEILPLHRLPIATGAPTRPGALQTRAKIPFAATIGLNFDGLGASMPGFAPLYTPPDTTGAAGATQYVQWVNTSFAVFDKATGNLILGPMDGNALWLGFGGGCEFRNDGDPIVNYDKQAGRWMLSQFTSKPPYLECVAVSQTSDATGAYYRYAFAMGANLADYPHAGVWPDAYYFSFNMFDGTTSALLGGRACAFDRIAMLAGAPATQICFDSTNTFGMIPSDWDGATAPPAGSPDYFVQMAANSLNIYSFHTDFTNPASATFTGPFNLPVAPFTPACADNQPVGGEIARAGAAVQQGCVPQHGAELKLEELSDRLMYRAAYRNFTTHESLVITHAVARAILDKKPAGAAIRWYELRGLSTTPTVFQQGAYAPNPQWRWMSSGGMDAVGDIAIGYSVSSPFLFPAIRVAGRTPADPAGTLEAETTVVDGAAPQLGSYRWGDYSAMSIDPADDCTFWYTTEYIARRKDGPNWNTRIASFKYPGCVAP